MLRLLPLAVVIAIVIGYVQPIRSYLDARADVETRRAERAQLLREQKELQRRLELADTDEFVIREARRLGLVRPGERLYIVSSEAGG